MSGGAVPGQVQSLVRALHVLRAIALAPQGLILRDVARGVGLPVSTAHRLLTTLQGERFVRADPETGAWTIGPEAFAVGQGFARGRDLAALARPRLRALMQRWSETASLFVEADGGLICVAQAGSRQTMRAVCRVGDAVGLHATAAGRAMLAALPPAKRKAALDEAGERGWAVDDEEFVEGVRCVAAAVRDPDGRPVAAVSVSGPPGRLTPAVMEALGPAVAACAATLSRDLGWLDPASAA